MNKTKILGQIITIFRNNPTALYSQQSLAKHFVVKYRTMRSYLHELENYQIIRKCYVAFKPIKQGQMSHKQHGIYYLFASTNNNKYIQNGG